jgi:hypothetical protein
MQIDAIFRDSRCPFENGQLIGGGTIMVIYSDCKEPFIESGKTENE